MALVMLRAVDQLHEVVDLVVGDRAQSLSVLALTELWRRLSQETRERGAQNLKLLELGRVGAGTTGILDFLLAHRDLGQTAGKLAARVPEIDLEGEGILPGPALDQPPERRVRDQAAVPVVLALDLDGGKAGRQRAARH